jgi:hypothetical protein
MGQKTALYHTYFLDAIALASDIPSLCWLGAV